MKTMTLQFQFDQNTDAKLALNSLQELYYLPSSYSIRHNTVDLHVDLESSIPSLEIMQAHGGFLLEDGDSPSADDTFSLAYQLNNDSELENNVAEHEEGSDIDPFIDPSVALGYYESALLKENEERNV